MLAGMDHDCATAAATSPTSQPNRRGTWVTVGGKTDELLIEKKKKGEKISPVLRAVERRIRFRSGSSSIV